MDVLLANPRGFCAGVDRAIEIVKRAIETLGAPIYVRHEVVHNRFVVDDLKQRAIFVEELDEVPDNNTVIFSAHGVSQAVRQEAERRGLKVFDATCPLVTKVHFEVARHCRAGRDVVLIGHAGHPEVEGTMGQWNREAGTGQIYLVEDVEQVATLQINQPENFATPPRPRCRWMTRAASSMCASVPCDAGPEERRHLLRHAEPPGCCARPGQALRPGAGGRFAEQLQLQPSERAGPPRRRGVVSIDGAHEIDPAWVAGKQHIGVTGRLGAAGAGRWRAELGATGVGELDGEPESMVFALPKELRLRLVD